MEISIAIWERTFLFYFLLLCIHKQAAVIDLVMWSYLAYLGSIIHDAMWVVGDIGKGIWLGLHPCSRKSSVLHVGIRLPLNVE